MSSQNRVLPAQFPISLAGGCKKDVRVQFAALCYRVKKTDKPQVLLVTSRTSNRWIIPRGWPIDGKTPLETAAIEAWEEAGAKGTPEGRCVGIFSYSKLTVAHGMTPCLSVVFPIKVNEVSDDYPEAGERERKWVSCKKAAAMVDSPELAHILCDFEAGLRG